MSTLRAKHPREEIVYSVDFTKWLADGETVSTCAVTAVDEATGGDVTAILVAGAADLSTAPIVKQKIQAGTADSNYVLAFEITTSLSQTFVATVELPVRLRP